MPMHEFIVIAINLSLLSFAYFWFFPRIAGLNLKRLAYSDLIVSVTALGVVGILFGNADLEFEALFFSLNWVLFTLITFALIEIPFFLWYVKKF
ncbi:MAG: hypothetical protein OEW60_00860 [Thiovulaceae bacterium]|nr:hypothetical protein [Sulfurimonadaceae bacterium]